MTLDICNRHPPVPNLKVLSDELSKIASTCAWVNSNGPRDFERRLHEQQFARRLCEEYGIEYSR